MSLRICPADIAWRRIMKAITNAAGPPSPDVESMLNRLVEGVGHVPASDLARLRARLARWLPAAVGPLTVLYGPECVDAIVCRLIDAVGQALVERPEDLRAVDAAREVATDWFQSPDRIGYVAYTECFGPTVGDVAKRAEYLAELGVTYFHLMKVLEPRPAPNDGGFAVMDYRRVDPVLGTNDDLRALTGAMRDHGISVCIDLVMNHTAREHEWARRARAGEQRYRDYFLLFPDRTDPDQFEKTLPEVFPEFAPGNFTWDTDLKAWVWTTFNTYQWDLNYANPDVLVEMFEIMVHLANLGVDVLRLDAVAFTWKRLGTNCQNQPEAHLIVQVLRSFLSIAVPGVLLKAEAIVGPRELTAYVGAHQLNRPECHVAYHNQLMVMVWSALATRDAVLLRHAMASLPQTPQDAGWVTYVRCHDDIGWAVDDGDASAVGISPSLHRKFLAEFYRGDFPGTFARGASFSVNEETGDERTCGMTASLCGITHAVTSGDQDGISFGIRRLLLSYGITASFGIPLLYMGDEIALGNDTSYLQDPAKLDDSRWMHRPNMNWAATERRHVLGSVEHAVFEGIRRIFKIRATTPPLAQGGGVEVIDPGDHRVFGFVRHHPRHGRLLGLANLSEATVLLGADLLDVHHIGRSGDELLAGDLVRVTDHQIQLAPLALAWFTSDRTQRVLPNS
jgi:amylosucrase